MRMILVVCLPYFLLGIYECFTSALKGMKKAVTAMVISLAGLCGFKLLWIYAVLPHLPRNVSMLYIAYPLAWALTSLAAMAAFFVFYRKRVRESEQLKADAPARL